MDTEQDNNSKEAGDIACENETATQPSIDKDEDKGSRYDIMMKNLQEVRDEVELLKLGFNARSDDEVKLLESLKLNSLFNCINEAINHVKYFLDKSKNVSEDNKEDNEISSFKNEVLPEQEQEVIPEQMFKVEIKEEYEEDEFDDHLPEVEYTDMLDQKYAIGNGNLGDGDGDNVKKEEVSDAVRTIKNEYVSEDPLEYQMLQPPITVKPKPKPRPTQRKLPPDVNLDECLAPDGKYKCPKCEDKIFDDYRTFRGHIKRHVKADKDREIVECQVCHRKLNRSSLRPHMLNHTEATFQCLSCPKKFATLGRLARHQRNVHELVKPVTCEICNKGFRDKQSLQIHSVVHTGEKPHVCEQCGNSYSQKSHLYYHIKKIHEGVKMKKYKKYIKKVMCGQCGKMLPNRKKLELHIKVVHEGMKIDEEERPKFNCPSCSTTFTLKSNLKRHIKVVHEGYKPFSCEYCEKKFSSKNEVKEHSTMHTGIKAYKCEECGKCFSQKSTWYGHKRKNHKEKDFSLNTNMLIGE